ncbi:(Na+)-NQR maturation NqrM [Pseudidiomarina terrestris]|uniref:(Na+)-NQR maturation NqrM n=1 Tax=Pseudidiomarina terrestris TaxID=2820060 RepID=A0AAW7R0P2_9GAMM|nr:MULTISPECIES: (Na+)-NQR maturation NqrM [unclassified Pseudidiomarina]MDN7124668.1 (Na+)-NQR maturation NqrM [Pseudidiomarina sp. 1APP75-32.1]MDN7126784.1 (Na+)-NQR maturation NqrM [Pseudidiomarina sp. 1APR75-33.1]MDN7129041.1 (Na+)-NQR maturation NqrM [Pseudidiomarina sp. 1APR75-15]MDN7134695.1 (Na+)-NQR maturation NqrM [Pseudidiomarina sp. 1ASP75-5]MDN7136635.1 (Na+)-NQR maturation NqrM [Pseudidiomarina sp. 1ASP75-14]
MGLFLLVFGIFLVVVLAMSVGFIVQRKTISGSCGGIASLGMDKACDCDEPCDDKKARMAKEQEWQKNRIN